MLCFVFAALVVALDQLFKRWIVLSLPLQEQLPLIPGVIGLTHVQNTGASFGIFSGMRWPLAAIMLVCIIALIFILRRYDRGFWGSLGLSAVLGGAVGNLLDRVLLGYVVDMFDLQFVNFAIFNIADCFITLGAITFCVHFIFASQKPKKAAGTPTIKAVYENQFGPADENEQETRIREVYRREVQPRTAPSAAEPASVPGQTRSHVSAPSPVPEPPQPEEHTEETDDAYLKDLGVSFEDYDVDSLLKEYGFEKDKD